MYWFTLHNSKIQCHKSESKHNPGLTQLELHIHVASIEIDLTFIIEPFTLTEIAGVQRCMSDNSIYTYGYYTRTVSLLSTPTSGVK